MRVPREITIGVGALYFALSLGVFGTPTAMGQTDNWLGGNSLWSDGTKWSLGVPGTTSNVFIDHGKAGTSSVTINYNGAQCADLTIDSDDSLTLVDGTIFTVFGPTIANAGGFSINAVSGSAIMDIHGAVTLTGAGNLTLSNNANNSLMGYAQPSPGSSLINQSTIQGAGAIGGAGGIGSGNTFTNQGNVKANHTTPLTITIGSATVTNTGTLEATNGATLALANGTLTNTGGTIHADPGSIVSLYNMVISGGALTTSGAGTGSGIIKAICCLGYSTLDGVVINGTFQWIANNIGYLHGTITNNGQMLFVNSTPGSSMILDVVGAVTLNGSGTLTSTNSNNQIMGYAQAGGASLLNQSTIQGTGQFGGAGGIGVGNSLINGTKGTIFANQKTSLFIDVNSGTFSNAGTLKVKAGSVMSIGGAGFSNFNPIAMTLTGGKYIVGGTLQFDNANIVTNASSITLAGVGSGIINQSGVNGLANLATNAKGSLLSLMSGKTLPTPGSFSNAGNVTVGANSTLNIGTPANGALTQAAGAVTMVDGTLTAPTGVDIQAGSLLGKGTINATVVSSGAVTAGDSGTKPGKLSLATYTQTATSSSSGSLTVPITSDTTFGVLAVSNGVSLQHGRLNIKRPSTYVPAIGKTFTILTGSTITGSFSNSTVSINSGEHFAISYNRTGTPQTVVVTVVSGP
jgi:hypothetical protein